MHVPTPYVIQISDTHLFEDAAAKLWGVAPDQALDAAIEALSQLDAPPSLVLVTGDCSADGSEASYLRLAGKLGRLGAPAYYVPGNHDNAERMARLLAGRSLGVGDKLDQDFEADGWRFILLDSSIPEQDWGALGKEQLAWLRDALAAKPDTPTIIVVHHNPLPIGSAWLDTMTIADADELLPIIDASPQVRAVLYGHIHQEIEQRRGATRYLSAPSTFFQFKPHWPTFAGDDAPPGVRIVHLHDSVLTTTVLRFGQPLQELN